MSPTANVPSPKPGVPSYRNLPAVVYFEGDDPARAAIAGLQHFLRLSFEDFAKGRDSETILITSQERMILDKGPVLRAPNVRVIALSDWRFTDPRTDGVVYAYLPMKTPSTLVERTIDNALDHIHLLATRRDVNERLAGATREIHELIAIGAAFSAEHDTEKLLAMVLTKCREVTRADAGSLFLVENEKAGKVLRLKLAQNDSLDAPAAQVQTDLDNRSIAAHVFRTGVAVNIEDAYHLPEEVQYQIDRKFDLDYGYRTKSILAVPMRTLKGDLLGVLQLINCKRTSGVRLASVKIVATEVVPFSVRLQSMAASLATQAAVALENSRLFTSMSHSLKQL